MKKSLVLFAVIALLIALPSCTKEVKDKADREGPVVSGAVYCDVDFSRTVTAGDTIQVSFTEAVTLTTATAADFILPVGGDSITGSTVTACASNTKVAVITLAGGPFTLSINDTFSPSVLLAGSPSGIDVAATNNILDNVSNPAIQTPIGGVDIGGYVAPPGPTVVSAEYTDTNLSGTIDNSDEILVTFTDTVSTLGGPAATYFNLPVSNDAFGTGASVLAATASLTVTISLGTTPNLLLNGTFITAAVSAGSPSGLDVQPGLDRDTIYLSSNPLASAQSGTAVDVTGRVVDIIPPSLTASYFEDDGDRVYSAGDKIILVFDEPVKLGNAVSFAVDDTLFKLPVAGNTIGTGATIEDAVPDDTEIELVLGTLANITVLGTYDIADNSTGAPTGIGLEDNWGGTDLIYDVSYEANEPQESDEIDLGGSFVPDTVGPILLAVHFNELDNILILTFDEEIDTTVIIAAQAITDTVDFELPVTGDSLGGAPTIEAHATDATKAVITLDTGWILNASEIYDPAWLLAGNASGFYYLDGAALIKDTSGNANPFLPMVLGDALDILSKYIMQDLIDNTITPMNEPRIHFASCTLNDGRVLVCGGRLMTDNGGGGNDYVDLDSAEIYDPVADTWTFTTGNMSTTRWYHTATTVSDTEVVIVGGIVNALENTSNTIETFDLTTGLFTLESATTANKRNQHFAFYLASTDQVIVLGGARTDRMLSWGWTAATEIYNVSSKTCVEGPVMETGTNNVTLFGAARFDGDTIIVVGGYTYDSGHLVKSLIQLVNATDATTASITLREPWHSSIAVRLTSGDIFVCGGGIEVPRIALMCATYISPRGATDLFTLTDPATISSTPVDYMLDNRGWGFEAIALGLGNAIAMGGFMGGATPACSPTATIDIFDPVTGSWVRSSQSFDEPTIYMQARTIPGSDATLATEDDFVLIIGGAIKPGGNTAWESTAKCYVYKP